MTRQTAKRVNTMLREAVVSTSGTGSLAQVQGYQVAGKTGTANKFDPETGEYSDSRYTSSFVGYVPADHPRLVISVVVDEPSGTYYGGEVAAPAFEKIAAFSLQTMRILPYGPSGPLVGSRARMTLHELIGEPGAIVSAPSGLHRAHPPPRGGPGALFCALPGAMADGHDYVAEAAPAAPPRAGGGAAGAGRRHPPGGRPRRAPRRWRCAAAVAGHPSDDLLVVGVTGTNGKTTSAFLLRAVLEAAGRPAGSSGPSRRASAAGAAASAHTTPDAVELQALFGACATPATPPARWRSPPTRSCSAAWRASRFAAALFTNLTRDHLDYHPDVEGYFAAKRRLFVRPEEEGPDPPGASNLDDEFGAPAGAGRPGPSGFAVDARRPVRPEASRGLETGIATTVATPRGLVEIASRLRGRFNLANITGVVALGELLGLPHEAVAAGIGRWPACPGGSRRSTRASRSR